MAVFSWPVNENRHIINANQLIIVQMYEDKCTNEMCTIYNGQMNLNFLYYILQMRNNICDVINNQQ